jgi:HEAT repeat protein
MWVLKRHDPRRIDAIPTYTRLLEERTYETRIIRYYAAMGLAQAFGAETPDRALDVLLEYLRDKNCRIYGGTATTATQVGSEARKTNDRLKESLTIDSRFLAADALALVGPRLQERSDILAQLNDLAEGSSTEARVRQAARQALARAKATK